MESLVSNVGISLESSCFDLARFEEVSSCDRSDCRCVWQRLGSDFKQVFEGKTLCDALCHGWRLLEGCWGT